VVAIGPKLRNYHFGGGLEGYEIPQLIQNGINGFVSDDVDELHRCCAMLMLDRDMAQEVGEQGRAKATALFGTETIAAQWRALLLGEGHG
jgi:glycosyltransferase involved in cell wall biosynthesis